MVAPAIVELSGGVEPVIAKAREFTAVGKPLEALHLLDIALAAQPDSAPGREAKKAAWYGPPEQTGGNNLWERMWIAAAIRDTEV